MPSIDISVIVNLHSEGILVHPTMLSLLEAKKTAQHYGISVEVLIVADRPDDSTREYIASCTILDFKEIIVEFGDLGGSRNAGVRAAQGKWIAFIDGDDLWRKNWLALAYQAAESDQREVVWHPAVSVYFGTHNHLFPHVDMEDPKFDMWGLAIYNYWTALSFASRALYIAVPYPSTDLDKQLGNEDWSWNMRVIEHGGLHKCVPDTAHVIRQKQNSLLIDSNKAKVLQQPTDLFRALIYNGHH